MDAAKDRKEPEKNLSALSKVSGNILPQKVFVGNLHTSVSEGDLIRIFQKIGKVNDVVYMWHKFGPNKGQPKGFAFVEMSSSEEAKRAISSLHGANVKGRRIVVSHAENEQVLANGAKYSGQTKYTHDRTFGSSSYGSNSSNNISGNPTTASGSSTTTSSSSLSTFSREQQRIRQNEGVNNNNNHVHSRSAAASTLSGFKRKDGPFSADIDVDSALSTGTSSTGTSGGSNGLSGRIGAVNSSTMSLEERTEQRKQRAQLSSVEEKMRKIQAAIDAMK
jgi:RNA recognition motif-containing protein